MHAGFVAVGDVAGFTRLMHVESGFDVPWVPGVESRGHGAVSDVLVMVPSATQGAAMSAGVKAGT